MRVAARTPARARAGRELSAVAVVGNLSVDRIGGGRPRIGGGVYHAVRALRLLSRRASVVARCGDGDRATLVPQLAALGVPLRVLHGERTTAFSFSYAGEARAMRVEAVGDAWDPQDVLALDRRVRWVHIAPLLRSDFPAETIAAIARGRQVLFDGQGLVRVPKVGPLELDANFDPSVLIHVSILKLAEEEAAVLGDIEALGVPEVIVTAGSRGSTVHAHGHVVHVPAHALAREPTGAGDAFGAAYLAARAEGLRPVACARRATSIVAELLR